MKNLYIRIAQCDPYAVNQSAQNLLSSTAFNYHKISLNELLGIVWVYIYITVQLNGEYNMQLYYQKQNQKEVVFFYCLISG